MKILLHLTFIHVLFFYFSEKQNYIKYCTTNKKIIIIENTTAFLFCVESESILKGNSLKLKHKQTLIFVYYTLMDILILIVFKPKSFLIYMKSTRVSFHIIL